MKDNLKAYKITLKVKGPVFVGNGKSRSKKEYIFLKNGSIAIVDFAKLYAKMKILKKEIQFETFLMENKNHDLNTWIERNGIKTGDITDCLSYVLNCDNNTEERKRLQLLEFVKDPYNNPYVPGSSIKGMLRTIMLSWLVNKDPERFDQVRNNIRREKNSASQRTVDRRFLSRSAKDAEHIGFYTLNKTERYEDSVNDVCQGLIIGDSEPLSLGELILCRKIDLHTDGTERKFPLFRECLQPGTIITFMMTIDQRVCPFSIDDIKAAIILFANCYNDGFISRYKSAKQIGENEVLLGGGVGYVSKTIIYPLFGYEEGLSVAQAVFERTVKNANQHKHYKDKQLGVSPHTLKVTHYDGKTLQFGVCGIESIEEMS